MAVGLTNTTHFLRSLTSGRVRVEAVALHQGRTQQLWQVDVTDEPASPSPTARYGSRTSPRPEWGGLRAATCRRTATCGRPSPAADLGRCHNQSPAGVRSV